MEEEARTCTHVWYRLIPARRTFRVHDDSRALRLTISPRRGASPGMRLPNTADTSRPWRIHGLPFRTGASTATCEAVTWVGMLPAAALAAGSYLKARVARTNL